MTEPKSDDQPDEGRPPRRPYVAPAVEEVAEFETLALSCGFAPGNAACLGSYTNS